MSAETIYKEMLDKFKDEALAAVKEAHYTIQGELLPYVNDDTESNARHRAVDLVNHILDKRFTVEDECIVVNGWRIRQLNNGNYNSLVDVLAAKAGDKAKDLKIERLERQLKESYEGRY